jgi:hypothetical protein
MLILGIVIILPRVKRYVDFSLLRMLRYPTLGLVASVTLTLVTRGLLDIQSAFISLLFKVMLSSVVYLSVILAFERDELFGLVRLAWSLLNWRQQTR